MAQGFRYAEIHEPDAHAGSEQHGKPARITKVERGILPPKAHLAQRREDQHQRQQDENIGGENKEPGEISGQEIENTGEQRRYLLLKSQGNKDKEQHHKSRDGEYLAVKIQPNPQRGGSDIVLPNNVVGVDQVGWALGGRYAFLGAWNFFDWIVVWMTHPSSSLLQLICTKCDGSRLNYQFCRVILAAMPVSQR